MTWNKIKAQAGTWFCRVAAPMLAVYLIGLGVLPQYGYTWHPVVGVVQGFVAPIAAAIKGGWFWGEKVRP